MKPFRGSPVLLEQSHRSLAWPTSPHVTWPHHPRASHLTPWAEVHFKNLSRLLSPFWSLHIPGFYHSSLASPAQISGLWLNLPSSNGSSLTTQCKLDASGLTSFLHCSSSTYHSFVIIYLFVHLFFFTYWVLVSLKFYWGQDHLHFAHNGISSLSRAMAGSRVQIITIQWELEPRKVDAVMTKKKLFSSCILGQFSAG